MVKKDCAIAYVDGSCDRRTHIAGYGIVFFYEDEQPVFFSGRCESESLPASNVSGEICAAQLATEKALEYGCRSVKIFHDYTGIADWVTGKWKATKDHTKEYRNSMRSYQNMIDIEFCKVKGHSGVKWNEKADQLAKAATRNVKQTEVETSKKQKSNVKNKAKNNNPANQLSKEELKKLEREVQKRGILMECARCIHTFHNKKKHKFKDFKNLRVGGLDRFSCMREPELEYLIVAELHEELQRNKMLRDINCHSYYASALKWRLRGLSLEEATHKVNVDKEISDNAIGAGTVKDSYPKQKKVVQKKKQKKKHGKKQKKKKSVRRQKHNGTTRFAY